jgi:nitroreductase
MAKSEDRLPRRETMLAALQVACQAPSLYNSQPWRWEVDGHRVRLYEDFGRLLPFTDTSGRQAVMSCGAALHHARVAFAALGWATTVHRFPSQHQAQHLATLEITARHQPTERDVAWAVAISRRWTNRGSYVAAMDPSVLGRRLREALADEDVVLATMSPDHRSALAEATARSAQARRYDATLVDELRWWAGQAGAEPRPMPGMSPPNAQPAATMRERCLSVTADGLDRATVLVLATEKDGLLNWLACGEALSAVLLECTAHGLATCPLSHLTELPESRAIIAGLLPAGLFPQVLVRVGVAAGDRAGSLPSRLPLSEVVGVVEEPSPWSPLRAVTLRDLRRSTSQ